MQEPAAACASWSSLPACRSSTAILHLWVNPQSRPFLEMVDVREERDSEWKNSKKLEHRGESGNQARELFGAFDSLS